jgi:hypothetical protein
MFIRADTMPCREAGGAYTSAQWLLLENKTDRGRPEIDANDPSETLVRNPDTVRNRGISSNIYRPTQRHANSLNS